MIYTLLGEEGGPTSLHKGAPVCIEKQRRGLRGSVTRRGIGLAHLQRLYLLRAMQVRSAEQHLLVAQEASASTGDGMRQSERKPELVLESVIRWSC